MSRHLGIAIVALLLVVVSAPAASAAPCKGLKVKAYGHTKCRPLKLGGQAPSFTKFLARTDPFRGHRRIGHGVSRVPKLTRVARAVRSMRAGAHTSEAIPHIGPAPADFGPWKGTMSGDAWQDDPKWFDSGMVGTVDLGQRVDNGAQVGLRLTFGKRSRSRRCPSRDGTVAADSMMKLIATVRASTDDARFTSRHELILTTKGKGHVGDDGRLKTFDAHVHMEKTQSVNWGSYWRSTDGGQFGHTRLDVDVTGLDPHKSGADIAKTVKIVAADARIWGYPEKVGNAELPGLENINMTLALIGHTLAEDFLKSERNFYDQAACLDMTVAKDSERVAPGSHAGLHATVTSVEDHQRVQQTVNGTGKDRATLAPPSGITTATVPADFTLSVPSTVRGDVGAAFEGTSNMGRSKRDVTVTVSQPVVALEWKVRGHQDDFFFWIDKWLPLTTRDWDHTYTALIPITDQGSGEAGLHVAALTDRTQDFIGDSDYSLGPVADGHVQATLSSGPDGAPEVTLVVDRNPVVRYTYEAGGDPEDGDDIEFGVVPGRTEVTDPEHPFRFRYAGPWANADGTLGRYTKTERSSEATDESAGWIENTATITLLP